jgi:hypothetical protein
MTRDGIEVDDIEVDVTALAWAPTRGYGTLSR